MKWYPLILKIYYQNEYQQYYHQPDNGKNFGGVAGENRFSYFKEMRPDIIYKNKNYNGVIEIKYKSKYNDKISLTNLTQLIIYMIFYNRKIREGYLIECFSSDKIYITYISMSFAVKFYNFYIKDKIKKLYLLYKKISN